MKIKKILVSEDDKTTRTLIERCLEDEGYAVVSSSNGLRSWEVLNDNPDVALVISDVMMPDLDGRDLVRRIQSDQRFLNLPIVIISGVVSLKEIKSLLDNGASRFMPKPLKLDELIATVRNLID